MDEAPAWVWFLAGMFTAGLLSGAGYLLWRWLNKRLLYTTKQGVKVYAWRHPWAHNTTCAELEEVLDRWAGFAVSVGLCTHTQALNVLSDLTLVWRHRPYKTRKHGWISGIAYVESKAIEVGWEPFLERTALAHELEHQRQWTVVGVKDPDHRRACWGTVAQFRAEERERRLAQGG